MSEILNGPAGRIARLRTLMAERGYDAVVVRDEANLRWLTGAMRVFDYTGEYPHVAFVTADECFRFLHTDSRYFNSFEENMPAGSPWKLDMDEIDMPRWVAEHARSTKSRVVAVEDDMHINFFRGIERGLEAEHARSTKSRVVAVEDDMHINFFRGIERGLEDCSICASLPLMHGDLQLMRAVKDAEEIELMRHAQSITDAAFAHMCEFIRPGYTEKQLRTELETFMFDPSRRSSSAPSSRPLCSITAQTTWPSAPSSHPAPTPPTRTPFPATAWWKRATSSSWTTVRATAITSPT